MKFTALASILLLALSSVAMQPAQPQEKQDLIEQSHKRLAGAGDLLADGKWPMPLKHTDVKIKITGSVASTEVVQVFTNPFQERIEAIYTFPLPSDAAVYDMTMQIGKRTIRSVVKKREEAQKIYQQARQTGQRAALLEQERPNIFTSSVANILPGDEIRITIQYFQHLPYDDGGYQLRFPMVVAPRFIPGNPTGKQSGGWAPDTTAVPDASRITPPVLKPGVRPGHNITLSVELDAGLPIRSLRSISHQTSTTDLGSNRTRITLARNDEIPNKDFVLEYQLAGDKTQATVLTARGKDGKGYFLLLAMPPFDYAPEDIQPKEITFIIDTSGSMSGVKIQQAKNALRALVHGLNPNDSFNIIRFSSDFSFFSKIPVQFNQSNVDRADGYIDGLRAGGGTQILAALEYAMQQPHDEERLPVIVLLTDGQVGNEAQVLQSVQTKLGSARLYTFGVGTALNTYMLRKTAQLGRGTVEFVSPHQNLEEVVARFQNRISSPVLTNVKLDWGKLPVESVYPSLTPDLFLARPLVVFGRMSRPVNGTVTIRGRGAKGPLALPVNIKFKRASGDATTLSRLWARGRIDSLSDNLYTKPNDKAAKQAIIDLALTHKLMTAFTSFVAVEEKMVPSKDGGPPRKVIVPVPLPEDWNYDAVFGGAKKDAMANLAGGRAGGVVGGVIGGIPAQRAPVATQPSVAPPPSNRRKNARKSSRVGATASGGAMGAGTGVSRDAAAEVAIPLVTANDRRQAVARYLLRKQKVNGVWGDAKKRGYPTDELQTTAIALLAYLGEGHTDRAGFYQAQVRRALQYLTRSVTAAGGLNGMRSAPQQVKTRALVLWALSEAHAATGSSRYGAAAERLVTALLKLRTANGLWPANPGGSADATTTAWAALAFKSAQNAGLVVPGGALTATAQTLRSSQKNSVEAALVYLLAGKSLSPALRRSVTGKIAQQNRSMTNAAGTESAVLQMLVARMLGAQALTQTEQAMLKALTKNQGNRGSEAGGFTYNKQNPAAASARAYLLLVTGNAQWVVLR